LIREGDTGGEVEKREKGGGIRGKYLFPPAALYRETQGER